VGSEWRARGWCVADGCVMGDPVAANVVKSGAAVWFAPVGEALPDENVAYGAAWGGNWARVGYTQAPLLWGYEDERHRVMIEEEIGAVREWRIRETVRLETVLAEFAAGYLALARGGDPGDVSVMASGAGQAGYEALMFGGDVTTQAFAYGFEGLYEDADGAAFPLRLFVTQGVAKLNGAMVLSGRDDAYTGIPFQVEGGESTLERVTADAVPWYGDAILAMWARDCATQPVADKAAALMDLVSGSPLVESGGSNAWGATTGLTGPGGCIVTSVVPDNSYTIIAAFANATPGLYLLFGTTSVDYINGIWIVPDNGSGSVVYKFDPLSAVFVPPPLTSGVLAIAGLQPYRNGVAEGVPAAGLTDVVRPLWLMGGNFGVCGNHFVGDFYGVLVFDRVLSAAENLAYATLLNSMAAGG